jgi:hypothetical protein
MPIPVIVQRLYHSKTLLIMRMMTILILALVMQVSAKSYSQKITISAEDISLKKALRLFKDQSGYSFLCDQQLLDKSGHLQLHLRNASLKEALDACLTGLHLSYSLKEQEKVVFIEAAADPLPASGIVSARVIPPGEVSGTVRNEKGEPMVGVSIVVYGKRIGATSDLKGNFKIHAVEGDVLHFSYVGYEPQKVELDKEKMSLGLSISLKPSVQAANEVVIIGVQTQSRKTTTSSVSIISGKDIENLHSPSVDALLQGRVAGLNVQLGSGEPGIAPTVVVRGNSTLNTNIGDPAVTQATALSQPLYVIDGVPYNTADLTNVSNTGTNFLAGINVNDI